jgi:hypothetical protein
MWNDGRLMHLGVGGQELHSPTSISDQQLAEDHLVACNFVSGEQFIQAGREGFRACQEADPH